MMSTYLGDDADDLDGFEFLTMAEAGEVGHWSVLGKLNERAGDERPAGAGRLGAADPGAPLPGRQGRIAEAGRRGGPGQPRLILPAAGPAERLASRRMPSGKTILAAGAALVALGARAPAPGSPARRRGRSLAVRAVGTTESEDSESMNEVPLVPTEQEPAAGTGAGAGAAGRSPTPPPSRTSPPGPVPDRALGAAQRLPGSGVRGPSAREFSGTGNVSLGTVNLSQPAIVKWTTGPLRAALRARGVPDRRAVAVRAADRPALPVRASCA